MARGERAAVFSGAVGYTPMLVPGTEGAVEVFGDWIPGAVAAEPLWDPQGERVRS